MQIIKAAKVTTTIKHKETGEKYKTEEDWKAKGIEEKTSEEMSMSSCRSLIYLAKQSRFKI